jgi:4-methylaminobutanoate oxidase (formaldehyde-forming)
MARSDAAVARIPLHHWHEERGAEFTASDGWQTPFRYRPTPREGNLLLAPVLIADLSANAKRSYIGRGVDALAAKLLGLSSLRKVRSACDLEPSRQDFACRLTENSLLLLSLTPSGAALDDLVGQAENAARIDVTTAYAGFSLLGARAAELLQQLTALDVSLSAFPNQSCAETNLAGVHALLLRPRRGGRDEILVYVGWDVGEYVWEQLWDAGQPLGLSVISPSEWYLNFAGPCG